ncbi:MAG: NAD(P)/FAD-dependent oxidoreductase [Candidatus Omnitrophica bacterium]|nr:NAD(P)/FAD-dependent oxidoreductase [Candidatus Omnitrophota bacterium]
MNEKYDYDAVIIGAGISGLVCGCYLAKAGLKTLIVEKNYKPGGYCCSYVRDGYYFKPGVHALGALRPGGSLNKILSDLGVLSDLVLTRHDPSYIIKTPEFDFNIYNSIDSTIDEFCRCFPREKDNIRAFLKYIVSAELNSLLKFRSLNFEQLLNKYFFDKRLKTVISLFILGFSGLPPWQVPSIVGCFILRDFVFDGGYCPSKGMQDFPDTLLRRFKELKGETIFCKRATKIICDGKRAVGITLQDGRDIFSKYVISACDARQTFIEFIQNKLDKGFENKFRKYIPSTSLFIVLLGLDKPIGLSSSNYGSEIILINTLDIKKIYSAMLRFQNNCLLSSFLSLPGDSVPDKISVRLGVNTIYRDHDYWKNGGAEKLSFRMINMAEKIFPGLGKSINYKFIATPVTFEAWTGNYQGAAYGWASIFDQIGNPDISQRAPVENLYLTGHWVNKSSGISAVSVCGFDTAKMIIKNMESQK